MVRFSFSNHELMALPQGALYWPARRALLVADLHLEKASWFARLGQMLPPYDSIATLSDLTALVADCGAEEIWCLGDSFHDRHGCDRLPERARALLSALTTRLRWTWITGNHDPGLCRPLRRRDRRGGLGRRAAAAPRGRSRRDAARAFGPFPSQAADQPSRPQRLAALLRRDRAQDHIAGVRLAHRRARRLASRDHPRGRPRRAGFGAGRRPAAALPDRRLAVERGKGALERRHLRHVVREDVRMARILAHEVLVIGLGGEEGAVLDPGDDRLLVDLERVEPGDRACAACRCAGLCGKIAER